MVCPVAGMRALLQQYPERKRGGREAHKPVFRLDGGAALLRSVVQAWLERAAVAVGLPPSRFGSHSLRIGGATALYHLCREVETVKRFGRWASSSFSLYLWEAVDAAKDLSAGMVASEGNLEASHGLGAEVAKQQQAKRKVRFLVDRHDEDSGDGEVGPNFYSMKQMNRGEE